MITNMINCACEVKHVTELTLCEYSSIYCIYPFNTNQYCYYSMYGPNLGSMIQCVYEHLQDSLESGAQGIYLLTDGSADHTHEFLLHQLPWLCSKYGMEWRMNTVGWYCSKR